jgi:hypothetical protein
MTPPVVRLASSPAAEDTRGEGSRAACEEKDSEAAGGTASEPASRDGAVGDTAFGSCGSQQKGWPSSCDLSNVVIGTPPPHPPAPPRPGVEARLSSLARNQIIPVRNKRPHFGVCPRVRAGVRLVLAKAGHLGKLGLLVMHVLPCSGAQPQRPQMSPDPVHNAVPAALGLRAARAARRVLVQAFARDP